MLQFLCVTDCKKTAVRCQVSETISYCWISEQEFFRSFIPMI